MKLSSIFGVLAASGLLSTTATAAGPACVSTCNTANAQCRQAGKNDNACLYAWHQCKAGCSAPAATPAKLQVTRPSANTVVIKTTAPAKH